MSTTAIMTLRAVLASGKPLVDREASIARLRELEAEEIQTCSQCGAQRIPHYGIAFYFGRFCGIYACELFRR